MVNKKILLLQPASNWDHPYAESPSIALLTLGAIAKENGYDVTVKHLDIDKIDHYDYDIIGITCNTFQVKSARGLVKEIRENSKAKIVLGGPHAVAWTDNDGIVDHLVIGEGENKWLSIIGSSRPEYKSIDEIPLPDYSLVDMSRFSGVSPIGANPSSVLFGSRGCPGKCIFCNTPVFWGQKVRYRNPKSIVDQISFLHKEYGMQEMFIQDDTFNANWPWAKEIFERIISRGLHKKMVFRIDCRANEKMLHEDFLKLASKAGVWNIFLGIESGSQKMLDRMNKHITIEEYKRAIRLIQNYGMKVQGSFIVGLPGETWETLSETQNFISETHPFMIGFGYATPFPETELRKEVERKGYLKQIDYADYVYGKIYCRTDELTFEDLESFKGFLN